MEAMESNADRLHRGMEQGINQRDYAVFHELISQSYVNHSMPDVTGPDGFQRMITMFVDAFPDLRVNVDDVLEIGDHVVTRGTVTGTHRGEFMGIPATGKAMSMPYIDIWRVQDGQFVDNWVQMDMLATLQQLGVIHAPQASTM